MHSLVPTITLTVWPARSYYLIRDNMCDYECSIRCAIDCEYLTRNTHVQSMSHAEEYPEVCK